ncbi:MAG: porphobilinogen synthase [Synergistaceae bacterium]|jgi:porphobilinogen synthase|nr:porphobilinogen synthase [Synergistaceae bacterium]
MSGFPVVRMRRIRENPVLRDMLSEVAIERRQLILPIFVCPGEGVSNPIQSMPGVCHWSVDLLPQIVEPARDIGVNAFLLFGLPTYKDADGTSAFDPKQPVQRALTALKEKYPGIFLIADTCMCEYTSHGHCGHLRRDGRVDNDLTLALLSKTAVSQAEAGADMVAPSDMMDGRVAAIRAALDEKGMSDVGIMSYAAKLASAFYGPFRDAAGSAPSFGDRRGYQLPPTNPREIIRDAMLDVDEGADMLIVKPAGPCLDIAARLRERTDLPLVGYAVSGEYMMLHSAISSGALDRERALLEYHTAIRRSGCDLVITSFAGELARILKDGPKKG